MMTFNLRSPFLKNIFKLKNIYNNYYSIVTLIVIIIIILIIIFTFNFTITLLIIRRDFL